MKYSERLDISPYTKVLKGLYDSPFYLLYMLGGVMDKKEYINGKFSSLKVENTTEQAKFLRVDYGFDFLDSNKGRITRNRVYVNEVEMTVHKVITNTSEQVFLLHDLFYDVCFLCVGIETVLGFFRELDVLSIELNAYLKEL